MSEPVIYFDDLATYFGDDKINPDRATALIADAQALCESVVSPLPDGIGPVVVKRVAARAYVTTLTPKQAQSSAAGSPYDGSAMNGGVWLSQQDRDDLLGVEEDDPVAAFTIGLNAPQVYGDPWRRAVGDVGYIRQLDRPIYPTTTGQSASQQTVGTVDVGDIPNLRAVTSNFTAAPGDEVWVSVPAGVTVTGTLLPEPAGAHARIKRIDQSNGTLTIIGTNGALIDGQASFTVAPLGAYEFDSDGVSFAVF